MSWRVRQLGDLWVRPSNYRRRNEPLLLRDEHDDYDEVSEGVSALLEENARLRELVLSLSTIVSKHFVEQG